MLDVISYWQPLLKMRLPPSEPILVGQCPVTLFSFRNKSWSYRGEGNANLVIAIPEERVIVRLRKCPRSEASDGTKIWREVEFSRSVMGRLLSKRFVNIPTVVQIRPWELEWLNEQLRPLRPRHRHHKSVFSKLAAVFPDLCLLPAPICTFTPTFCVEVKPKQGWIPLADRRLPKCTFCLNQFLKLSNGSVTERSEYCPLNLFSGDRQRMTSAIRALVQCPQNNFKMFCNGTLQYGENCSLLQPFLENWFGKGANESVLLDNVCSVILQSLTADFADTIIPLFPERCSNVHSQHQGRIPKCLLDKAASLLEGPSCYKPPSHLPPGCILSRILRIQQLDVSGSDEVHRIYSASHYDDYEYVTNLLNPSAIYETLHSYLIATTAKDCSILISFQRASDSGNESNIVEDLNGNRFVFNIGVSDLDPKPMSCIEKHRRRDLEVVQSCISWLEGKRRNTEPVLT